MEDDDEFGDLYTDVLQPFASSPSPNHHQSAQQEQRHSNSPKESDVDFIDKDVKFDIEDDDGIHDDGIGDAVIPGLSHDAGVFVAATGAEASKRIDERGEGDADWDSGSDSDDDLQIVLNDDNNDSDNNNHLMAMERGDDDGLNIVAGDEPNQGAEEQEWGENSTQPVDGERKDHMGESAKGSGVPVPPKIGYTHHPFHSQFKYVRPAAAPMPGATTSAPGGPPGQIRPLANMNPVVGRGRGDWRPAGIKGAAAMQKGFHAGLHAWGSSGAGRGFGVGLEFTLPSHKTIFDVDIDSFEEKPWKYPGVDASVFFNFDLNEDSWKDYCKQLGQLRLESTMQSKIRVYESGRTGQDFDPDLPPELAAAAGIQDDPAEHANSVKSDVGQSDIIKGSGRVRPPIPPGRAIQVEGGYGERLPSIDTRPPRIRDSDAIIEIVLQDTADDDSSTRIDVQDQPEGGEPQREDFRDDHAVGDEIRRMEPEYFDSQSYSGQKRERAGRRMSFMNSSPAHIPDEDENLPLPQDEPIDYSDSRHQTPRQLQGSGQGQSPCNASSQEMKIVDNQKEESVKSMEVRCSALLSSPVIKDARESSVENKDAELEETGTADGSSRLEKEDIDLNTVDKRDTLQDEVAEREKLTSQVDLPLHDEGDDWEDSRAARSSDNSKARSASSRDYQKHQEGFEEEVVQDPRSVHLGSIRRQPNENEQVFHRREHDGRQEPERNHMLIKNREESYPYKNLHPSSAHQLHTKIDGFDRQKDRDSSDMDWSRREDDLISRRVRNDEPRKRDRGKVRENERSDKDDDLHSRKELRNGIYRVPYDKDVGSRVLRHRERGDGLKGKHEAVEDFHIKRRKDEEYIRREHIDKEEIQHGYRQIASRRRREKDEVDPWKRDDHQRSKDNVDDQYAAWQKDEAWLLRERGDRQRDREEWHRGKQSHEEHPYKREREVGRSSVRSGRVAEEKIWVGHVRAKDEHKVSEKHYQSREATRHSDQLKRRDRVHSGSPHHEGHDDAFASGNQYRSEERRSRQERSSSRSDRVANASDNQGVHGRKQKEGSRKSKEPVVGGLSSIGMSKRSQGDQSGQINEKGLKGSGNEEHVEHEILGHSLSRKHQEDISLDDEQQDSQQGRSKLERWTSHKERDFSVGSKSSSSMKFKDIDKHNNDGASEAGKPVGESAKIGDTDNIDALPAEGKDSIDMENENADTKGLGGRHLDTVEKLKKRSERFKLPMPSEKEALVIKKLESEPLPSTMSENPVDSEVKQERPPRKRRWITK